MGPRRLSLDRDLAYPWSRLGLVSTLRPNVSVSYSLIGRMTSQDIRDTLMQICLSDCVSDILRGHPADQICFRPNRYSVDKNYCMLHFMSLLMFRLQV